MSRTGSTTEPARTSGRLTEQELLSALPARSMNREIRVGIFVLIGIVAFLVALFTLTDVGTFRGRYYVSTVVESAGGMRRGDPVQMRGVNIGRVTGFRMVPDGVSVELELYDSYDVPEDSHVLVRSSGLLGGMVVDVVPGNSAERVDEGEVLAGGLEPGVLEAAAGLGGQAETVLARVDALLSRRTVGAVGESAVELQALLAELNALTARQRVELAEISSSLRRSAAGVERATAGPELERSVARIDSLTARLDATRETLDRASSSLQSVLGRIERGEGTLGKLSADDQLYDNLNTAAVTLRDLIADIRRDPRRYLNVSVF
jgi:phospholipid/cholesterol/gamma-HCH transport system substrate-binding protein